MPSRQRSTLNSRRAASPLVRLVERKERLEASDHPQGAFPQNWGENGSNRTVTCMELKATAFAMINFVYLDLALPIRWL
ncbi:hypothetical protein TNCV_4442331 [Trichonephila clavipes]|nr:hypothetical protein TNCV_4442331 [Trichonephila clavipes]